MKASVNYASSTNDRNLFILPVPNVVMSNINAEYDISVAIVGLGNAGIAGAHPDKSNWKHSHYGALYNLASDIHLVDLSKDKQEQAKIIRRNNEPVYSDIQELPNIDIATVPVPPTVRLHAVKDVIECGVNAIVAEKPLADNMRDAEEIVNLCEKNNITLVMNHTLRYTQAYKDLYDKFDDVESMTVVASGNIDNSIHGAYLIDWFEPDHYDLRTVWNSQTIDGNIPFDISIYGDQKAAYSTVHSPLTYIDDSNDSYVVYHPDEIKAFEQVMREAIQCTLGVRNYPTSDGTAALRSLGIARE